MGTTRGSVFFGEYPECKHFVSNFICITLFLKDADIIAYNVVLCQLNLDFSCFVW